MMPMEVATVDTGSAVSTPDVGSSGGSWESDLLSTLEQTPGGEAGSADTAVTESTGGEPVPGGEAGSADTAASSYQLHDDQKNYLVPKDDVTALTSARNYSTAVQQYFPTPDHAVAAFETASNFDRMHNDWAYSSDLTPVLQHFYGGDEVDPSAAGAFRAAFERMIPQAVSFLGSQNPQQRNQVVGKLFAQELDRAAAQDVAAYASWVYPIIQREIGFAYDRALQSGDAQLFKSTQHFDYLFNKRYFETPEAARTGRAQATQEVKPQVSERERELERREQQFLQAAWTNFDRASVNGPKWAAFEQEIDKTLAPIKDKYDETEYNGIRDLTKQAIIRELQQDGAWTQQQNHEYAALADIYQQSMRSGQTPATLSARIRAFQNDFMSRVRQKLPLVASRYISRQTNQRATQQPRQADGRFSKQQPSAARSPQQSATTQPPTGTGNRPKAFDLYEAIGRDMAQANMQRM